MKIGSIRETLSEGPIFKNVFRDFKKDTDLRVFKSSLKKILHSKRHLSSQSKLAAEVSLSPTNHHSHCCSCSYAKDIHSHMCLQHYPINNIKIIARLYCGKCHPDGRQISSYCCRWPRPTLDGGTLHWQADELE